jgi:hypothetical protein
MPIPVLGLGSGVGKSLIKTKSTVIEDPPIVPGKRNRNRATIIPLSSSTPSCFTLSFGSSRDPPENRGNFFNNLWRSFKKINKCLVPEDYNPQPISVHLWRGFLEKFYARFGKFLAKVVAAGVLGLAAPKLNSLEFRVWDVSSAHRTINPDSTSFLSYELANDSFLAVVVDDYGDTLIVDTVVQSPSVVEGQVNVPDGCGFRVFGGCLELLVGSASPEGYELKVFDVAGRRVLEKRGVANPGVVRVDLGNLSSGSYFAVASVDNRCVRAKFVVVDGRVLGLKAVTQEEGSGIVPGFRGVLTPESLESRVLATADSVTVFVRELADTLTPQVGDTGQPWIGGWYDFEGRFPVSVLELDTFNVLMIPFQELSASDSLGNVYFPGGWLHGMKKLTDNEAIVPWGSQVVRWGDDLDISSLPLRVVTITGDGSGVPVLDSVPDYIQPFFDSLLVEVVSGTDSLLPLMVVPFDSSMVSPPLPEHLPYQTLDGVPDNVNNAAIYVFGNSGEVSHPGGPGWTSTYLTYLYDLGGEVVNGAWMEINTDATPTGLVNLVLRREFGRGIGFYARGPPPYIMYQPYGYTGDGHFHPDELLIMKLFYSLPILTKMSFYKTND